MKKIFFILLGGLYLVVMAVFFGTATMLLWNELLSGVFNLPIISWQQAIGLFVLCRILFGGITGGFFGRDWRRKNASVFRDRWDAMSEEQREHLAQEIKKRHGFNPHGFRGGFFGMDPFTHKDDGESEDGKDDTKKDE
jgi:hypothetical protein